MTTRTITLSAEHWQAIKNALQRSSWRLDLCEDDLYVSPDLSAAYDALEAALAQPEPVGLTPDHVNLICFALEREPWATWLRRGGCLESAHCELSDLMLAVLARWGRPTLTPIPVSEFLEPEWMRQEDQTRKTTDHAQLIDGEWWAPCSDLFSMQRILDNARAHAARSAIEPVPVGDRWPEFSDCDQCERVWVWNPILEHWKLTRLNRSIHTHWLPHWALPVPTSQEATDA